MSYSKTKLAFLLSAITLFAYSCDNNTNNQYVEIQDDSTSAIIEQSEKLLYPIPTPLEISNMLNKAGANYILEIANKSENADKYFTEGAKALNLGIYGADLSYSATYYKSQETLNFYICAKKLREALDVHTPQSDNLTRRIEQNIDNRDSLYSILTYCFKSTFDYLNDNERGSVSLLVLAGGWIEGLYISTELAELTNKYQEIYQGIADQKETLMKLIPLMENYKDNRKVSEILTALYEIRNIFSQLEVADGKAQLTKESFEKIKNEVDPLRTRVIETP